MYIITQIIFYVIYWYDFHISKLNNLKVIDDFIFSIFDSNLIQNII
jgi:hypothetical protein